MFEKVVEIIKEQLNLENAEIRMETSFKEDLDVDSLDLFELVMALEEEYDVEIPSEDLEQLTTVGEVVDDLKQFDVYFDGQPYRAGKWILQNSQIAEPENTIKEGDQLKSIEALTLGQFLVQMGLTLDTLCLINGEPAMPETLLKENDHIRQLSVKPPIKPTVQEPSPLEETAEASSADAIISPLP